MDLPIDQSGFTFVALGEPEKKEGGGVCLDIAAIRGGKNATLHVTLPRDPRIREGQSIQLKGLSVRTTVLYADGIQAEPPAPAPDHQGP